MSRAVLAAFALLLAGIGTVLAHDQTVRAGELLAVAPAVLALVALAGPGTARRWRARLLALCAAAAVGYALAETVRWISDGVLFWWPAVLLCAAALPRHVRRRAAR